MKSVHVAICLLCCLGARVFAAQLAYVGADTNKIKVLDTATNQILNTITVGAGPNAIAVNPAGTRVYVANGQPGTVSVIDTATNLVVQTVTVGSGPRGIAVNPSGTRVFVANGALTSNAVSVIDTSTNTVVATANVGSGPHSIAFMPDGNRAYVVNNGNNGTTVSVLNAANYQNVANVTVGFRPTDIAITPDGSKAYVANNGDGTVSVINTATNTTVATISTGVNPSGIAVNPTGTRVYVTNQTSATISVIDTATNTVVQTISGVGSGLQGIAVTPDGTRVYAAAGSSGAMTVINAVTNAVVASVPVGTSPYCYGKFIGTVNPPTTYTIATSSSPPAGGSTSGGGTKTAGESVSVAATPASGYSFTNWTENSGVVSNNATYTFTASANRTLVANFSATPVNYTLAVSAAPAAGGSVTGAGTYAAGTNVTATATPASGYTFTAWTASGLTVSTAASYTFAIGGNVSLVANFTAQPTYAISTSSSPPAGGTTAGGGNKIAGSSVSVFASPATGYSFTNWTENGGVVSNSATYTFTATANRTLVANFANTPTFYSVSLNTSPATAGSAVGGGTFAAGTNVTVTATAAAGFTFIGWAANNQTVSTSPSYTFTIGGNISLTAMFTSQPAFAITTSSSPAAGGTTSGGGNKVAGSTIQVVAVPAAGYSFVSWLENGATVSGSATYSFVVSGNRNLVATFSLLSLPTVVTTSVVGGTLTANAATLGGNVTNAGGSAVTTRGIAFGTSPNPTTANSTVTAGSGVGSFSASLTGLNASTPYHARAFATNSGGTAYGDNVSFTTLSSGISISPASREIAAAGATGQTIAVTTNSSWTATSSAPWATITAGPSGSGNGTVTYSVAANTSPGAVKRQATIVVSGQTHTILQTAFDEPSLPDDWLRLAAIERTFLETSPTEESILMRLRSKTRYGIPGDPVRPQRANNGVDWEIEIPDTEEKSPIIPRRALSPALLTNQSSAEYMLLKFHDISNKDDIPVRLVIPNSPAEGTVEAYGLVLNPGIVVNPGLRITLKPGHPQYTLLGSDAQICLVRRFDFAGASASLPTLSEVPKKWLVFIHGWNPGGKNDTFDSEFKPLIQNAQDYLHTSKLEDWRVASYNWWKDAATGESLETYIKTGFNRDSATINGWDAAEVAYLHGLNFSDRLEAVTGGNIAQVHLVAHSAGNWVAYAAARYLRKKHPEVIIQVTALDAYIPAESKIDDRQLPSPLTKELFARMAGRTSSAFDSYFVSTERSGVKTGDADQTGAGTQVEFNQGFFEGALRHPVLLDLGGGHSLPITRYGESVRNMCFQYQTSDDGLDRMVTDFRVVTYAQLPSGTQNPPMSLQTQTEQGWRRSLMHRELAGSASLSDLSGDMVGAIRNSKGASVGIWVLRIDSAKVGTAIVAWDGVKPEKSDTPVIIARDRTFRFSQNGRTYTGFIRPGAFAASAGSIVAGIPTRAAADGQQFEVVVTDSTGEYSSVAPLMAEKPELASRVGTYDATLSNGDRLLMMTLPSGRAVAFTTAGGTVSLAEGTFNASGAITINASTVQVTAQIDSDEAATLTGSASLAGQSGISLNLRAGQVSFPEVGRLVNLSIRTQAGTGAQTLIVGFNLSGTGTNQLLVRGVGPTLTTFGVTGVLADPALQLFRGSTSIATNDNWGGTVAIGSAGTAVGAFPLPTASRDAVLLETLSTGSYTAQIGGGTGAALVELYDVGAAPDAKLSNVSARSQIGGGDVLTAGFVVRGPGAKTILIRAVGPTLGAFGVTNALADPKLELYRGTDLLQTNDNWNGTQLLANAFTQVGAFPLPATSNDAALYVTLQPGAYTAQITGVNGATGVALVEVYEVP